MIKKKKVSFYEGLFAIQAFWLFVSVCLIIVFLVIAIFHGECFYVPIIIFFASILIMLFSYLLATKCLRKVLIDENGITINKRKQMHSYSWAEIETVEVKTIKIKDTIFTYDFFFWLFRMSYLNISFSNSKMTSISVLIGNKYKDKVLILSRVRGN